MNHDFSYQPGDDGYVLHHYEDPSRFYKPRYHDTGGLRYYATDDRRYGYGSRHRSSSTRRYYHNDDDDEAAEDDWDRRKRRRKNKGIDFLKNVAGSVLVAVIAGLVIRGVERSIARYNEKKLAEKERVAKITENTIDRYFPEA